MISDFKWGCVMLNFELRLLEGRQPSYLPIEIGKKTTIVEGYRLAKRTLKKWVDNFDCLYTVRLSLVLATAIVSSFTPL